METTLHEIISLFPGKAPGSEDWQQPEEETRLRDGLPVVRNVTQPTLTVYPAEKPNGIGMIVAPGGAWHFLAIEHEGRMVAEWLAKRGVTAFILKYRLIQTGPRFEEEIGEHFAAHGKMDELRHAITPLSRMDAQQAVRFVRECGGKWGVDPRKIGFMGFSAGGGVTADLVLNSAPDCRPDFAAPIYAAVFEDVVAPQDAPPLFLLCAADDNMAVNASRILFSAWKAINRPVEMHIYDRGGHGFGMYKKGLPVDTWIERFEDWMKGVA